MQAAISKPFCVRSRGLRCHNRITLHMKAAGVAFRPDGSVGVSLTSGKDLDGRL